MPVAEEIVHQHQAALSNVLALSDSSTRADGSVDRVIQAGIISHCPFGCALEDLDEYGYCGHLVGFSNDGKTYEPVRPLMRFDKEGKPYDSGYKQVVGGVRGSNRQPCLPGDRLVNPEHVQKVNGIQHLAKLWLSDRVYRPQPDDRKPSVPLPAGVIPGDAELEALRQRKAALEVQLQKKELAEQIAALEAQVGDPGDEDDSDDSGDDKHAKE